MAAPLASFRVITISRLFSRLPARQRSITSRNAYIYALCKKCTIGFKMTPPGIQPKWLCRYMSHSLKDRKCWKCDTPTNEPTELFFCNCGVVQNVPTDLTYFEAMDCGQSFDIDASKLPTRYKALQKHLHPDKYSQKSKEEQTVAEKQSAFINKAYNTLLKPLSRGLYLLELQGNPLEEKNSDVDPAFLMEVMEINEDIIEALDNVSALEEIDRVNGKRIKLCVSDISDAFKADNIAKAKESLIKLKYFTNIEDKIKEVFRSKMDHH